MIVVVDTGGANIGSVFNALDRARRDAELTSNPDLIIKASHVIMPGVGAARDSMDKLNAKELVACLRELKQPTIGICLGMQLLFERSEEGDADCLGILPGEVRRFRLPPSFTVPHMGWNQVRAAKPDDLLLRGIPDGSNFYFVHSYAAPMGPWASGICDYGGEFPAMVAQGNFFGAQFHPEKSAEAGAKVLENFLNL